MGVAEEFRSKTGQPGNSHTVIWYNQPIAEFCFDQSGEILWRGFTDDAYRNLFRHTPGSDVPQFLVNLLPENAVFEILDQMKQHQYISSGIRFLSNFRIVSGSSNDLHAHFASLGNDYIYGELSDYTDKQGVFTGVNTAPLPESLDQEALSNFAAEQWKNRRLPRFSGAEIKIPVHLSEDGELSISTGLPFTHIMKFPVEGPQAAWGVNEWMCMQLSEAIGLPTPSHAMVPLEGFDWPAYIVERFDITKKPEGKDTEYLVEQDFCTLCEKQPKDKDVGSVESIAKVMKATSEDWPEDREILLKRIMLSWLVNDGDMHRKNLSMLYNFNPETNDFTARSAPTYDVTSEIYEDCNFCLTLGGKKIINPKSLTAFATQSLGFSKDEAQNIFNEVYKSINEAAQNIIHDPPELIESNPECMHAIGRIVTIVAERSEKMGYEPPEFERTKRIIPNIPKRIGQNLPMKYM